ncbi:hypothetical protein [Klebsiella pneumoniae]|nr:hypothetical protein [Salmonella enterica subsp. enterica serovar Enteritidis]HAO0782625.1 hypothetical protein [Escherichia coli]
MGWLWLMLAGKNLDKSVSPESIYSTNFVFSVAVLIAFAGVFFLCLYRISLFIYTVNFKNLSASKADKAEFLLSFIIVAFAVIISVHLFW